MEEKLLKEEIDNLKKELEKESTINSNKESVDEAGGDQTSTHAILQQKEKELELSNPRTGFNNRVQPEKQPVSHSQQVNSHMLTKSELQTSATTLWSL